MLYTHYRPTQNEARTEEFHFGDDFYCRLQATGGPSEREPGLSADESGRFHFVSSQIYVSPPNDRVVLLAGEIDNSKQLVERYGAPSGWTHTPDKNSAELISSLYDELGICFLERLRGPFSLAIWDSEKDRLLVSRSVAGQHAIYFTQKGGTLHLSSSLRRLCSMLKQKPDVDQSSLGEYLRWGGVRAPNTLLTGVYSVCASEWIAWSGGDLSTGTHWSLPPMSRWDIDIARAESLVDEKLSDAMSQCLAPMARPGCLLSGSLNSSTLVAYGAKERRPGQGFTTYGLSSYFNSRRESRLSRQVAGILSTEFIEVWQRDEASETAWNLARALDCPSSNRGLIHFHLLMNAKENSSDGVLAGFGGDELFAGRPYHLMTNPPGLVRALPNVCRSLFFDSKPGSWKTLTDPCEVYRLWTENFTAALTIRLLGGSERRPDFRCTMGDDPLRSFVEMDLCHRLPDTLLSSLQRIAGKANRKLRLPFLNRDLIELTCLIPQRFILNGLASKFILRRLLQRIMPPHVLHELPDGRDPLFNRWLRHDLREILFDALADSNSLSAGMMDRDELSGILSAHFTGEQDFGGPLWSLLILELWWRSL